MISRLLPKQCIHAPPTTHTSIYAVGVEPLQKLECILG